MPKVGAYLVVDAWNSSHQLASFLLTVALTIMSAAPPEEQKAPRYTVPKKEFVTVEHPFVVKNADKAIDMPGGRSDVVEALKYSKPLSLSFNPGDRSTRSLGSLPASTDNILLRITVPKRIGKRKRGSGEPFIPLQASSPVMRDAKHLLRSMRDNKEKMAVEAIGSIQQSYAWRSIPDFNYSTRGLNLLSNLESNILSRDYDSLQQWDLPKTYGLQDTEIAPPPVFSSQSLQQPYVYYRPIMQKTTENEEPGQSARVRSDRVKSFALSCSSAGPFPISPPANAPELDSMIPAVQKAVVLFRDLFKQRPIWTRRALVNHVEEGNLTSSHQTALAYIGFSIASGVWSRTLCIYGVNPLSDPSYRKFQTVATINDQKRDSRGKMAGLAMQSARSVAASNNRRSHVFTGKGPLPDDGSIYQLCDLADPQLKSLVDVGDAHLSEECDPETFGWYGNGTMSKIRIILRAKTSALRNGEPTMDKDFKRIIELPERCELGNTVELSEKSGLGHLPNSASVREKAMAKAYREGCRNAGRFKMRNRDNAQRFESDDDDYDDDDDDDDEATEVSQSGNAIRKDNVESSDGSIVDGQDDLTQKTSMGGPSGSPSASNRL